MTEAELLVCPATERVIDGMYNCYLQFIDREKENTEKATTYFKGRVDVCSCLAL